MLPLSDAEQELNWVVHKSLLSPGTSVFPLVPLTKNNYNICKFIFENNIEEGGSKTLDKDVTEGRCHGRVLNVWLW